MKLLGQEDGQVEVRLSFEELILLNNALNEMCHGLQLTDRDFLEILGAPRQDANLLLKRVGSVLDRLGIMALDK